MLVTCNAEVRREWGLPSSKIKRHHPTILIAMPNPQEQEKEIIFCHHSSFFVAIADPPAPFFTFVSDSVFFFFFYGGVSFAWEFHITSNYISIAVQVFDVSILWFGKWMICNEDIVYCREISFRCHILGLPLHLVAIFPGLQVAPSMNGGFSKKFHK